MDLTLELLLEAKYLWDHLLILGISPWGPAHIRAWEARAQEWDQGQVRVTTAWEDLAQSTQE